MADKSNRPNPQNQQKPGGKPNPGQQRTTIILIVVLFLAAAFIGSQFLNMGQNNTRSEERRVGKEC